jgi:hypothetical protein
VSFNLAQRRALGGRDAQGVGYGNLCLVVKVHRLLNSLFGISFNVYTLVELINITIWKVGFVTSVA